MLLFFRLILFALLVYFALAPDITLAELLIAAIAYFGFEFNIRRQQHKKAVTVAADEIRATLRLHPTLYYNRLQEAQKQEFEARVIRFIAQKTFIPRGPGMDVTTEMQMKIAACAVQLTFGLPEIHFSHFKTFLLYPERYYSTIYKQYHCGEVNMRGIIVLSWRDFETGNYNPADGLNLGLHEMAHALHLENGIPNGEYDFLNREYLYHWATVSETERERLQTDKSIFRRLSSAPDTHEFFAVAVELFFELPLLLKQEHPGIYSSLANLLNQDPATGAQHAAAPPHHTQTIATL
ncbi:zinc-dependent peptidase [Pontibacter sp. Tf4]|uniref:zinc-dependent peptidase n=1 Tax=Pontibacter sp. Tf4 TaxID=2761620 RepID=UPI001625FD48|nr:zinc-dependent peptidase [Pontibacter sp. Tf4]MBB6610940.1 zinc-dependent peptidase [Pontibacter sp. Tf4]